MSFLISTVHILCILRPHGDGRFSCLQRTLNYFDQYLPNEHLKLKEKMKLNTICILIIVCSNFQGLKLQCLNYLVFNQ